MLELGMYLTVRYMWGNKKNGPYQVSNSTIDVSMRLSQPIHGTGRNLTTDNWFSSFPLADSLLAQNVTLVGTLKKNKKELPPELINQNRPLKSSMFAFQRDKTVVSYATKKK